MQEHARDSFENLLFSLCRFYELTGHYPDHLLVIGYDFKHERFADLHRAALRWPDQRFTFIGTPALTANAQEVSTAVCADYLQGHLAAVSKLGVCCCPVSPSAQHATCFSLYACTPNAVGKSACRV